MAKRYKQINGYSCKECLPPSKPWWRTKGMSNDDDENEGSCWYKIKMDDYKNCYKSRHCDFDSEGSIDSECENVHEECERENSFWEVDICGGKKEVTERPATCWDVEEQGLSEQNIQEIRNTLKYSAFNALL